MPQRANPLSLHPSLHLFGLKLAVIAALGFPSFAQDSAPASTDSEKALERVENALNLEQALSTETKEALRDLLRSLRAECAGGASSVAGTPAIPGTPSASTPPAVPSTAAPGTPKPAASRFKVSGDFRLRQESSFKLDDQPSRSRQRARFRVGATYQATDEVTAGVRLVTGARTDAQSPHVTLGEVFHKFESNLDRVFLNYKPKGVPGLSLTGGKFAHTFWQNPVYGELVWDADVQPEGISLNYSRPGSGAIERYDFTAGEYVLLEQARSDSRAFVAQASVHGKIGQNLKPSLALGYYRYGDLAPNGSQAVVSESSGNATVGAGANLNFASRFSILNPIAALRFEGGRQPIVLSAEYIKNLRANINDDQGWAVGAAIGAARKRGDWRAYYQLQKVEQDAVLSVVSQDDFLFSTNHRSHLLGANYMVRDNLGFNLWTLASRRDRTGTTPTTDSDKLQWRLRLDANLAF
jgi:hypothetical protein